MLRHLAPHHATRHVARSSRRSSGERGAVTVELAVVAILLLTLVAGTFDYGFAWRTGLAGNEAARTGARVGSSQALSRGADYYALNGLRASLRSSGVMDDVRKVVIFKSTTADGEVPTSCLNPSPTGTCNVLTGAQLDALTVSSFNLTIPTDGSSPTGTGCLTTSAAMRAGWCPNARSNNQDTGADYYGVYVELFYDNQFSILGNGTAVKRTAVMRLEPTGFGG
jgi:Flp pilus assembly protein TadG